jgi:flagellar M-ring protein FliF
MADLVPVPARNSGEPSRGSILTALTDPAGGSALTRLRSFAGQPPVKKALPWFALTAGLGGAALMWQALAPQSQRMLYSALSDGERAQVAGALDKASIKYHIDNSTGAITVGEDDLYKARMLVASDGALAAPETGQQMLDKLPMGASRGLEGERRLAAREREMELTIKQIDGVDSVRVHLAEQEKSVFVRDSTPPTASVMVKLASGRSLAESQVQAIVNLVAGSVPGMTPDAVKVVDQHGRLLSAHGGAEAERFELQGRMEDKLRRQVSQLLAPMVGAGNFSSEIQVELDMDEQTSARESYDKNGVVRSEMNSQSQNSAASGAVGVPGVLSNTPPPPTAAQSGAPQGTPSPAASGPPAPQSGESASTKTYELGREVAVSTAARGKLKRLSVAVGLSDAAFKKAKPADIDQIKQLVSAAVGANPQRGDVVTVMVRKFEPDVTVPVPFYEAPWFAMVLRNAVALIAVLMFMLMGVRPLVKALKRDVAPAPVAKDKKDDENEPEVDLAAEVVAANPVDPETGQIDDGLLQRQIGLAQQLAHERPESAVVALRQLLKQGEGAAAKAA